MKYATNTLDYYWMPFTSNRDFKDSPRLFVKGEGVHYWSHNGGQILDGSSGLFCCALGHGREEIAKAVYEQLMTLDYGPPFQAGSPGQFELARKVAALTPEGIDRIFFTNSGSESVDTALKIALAYHRARGDGTRMRFVSRERAYHGVNIGGTSLAGMVKNREAFGIGMGGVAHMRHTWLPENRFSRGQPETGVELADDLERIVAMHGAETVAACIVEPVAGSTGTLVPPKGYLDRLREICDRHGILLIFDEVICGFGRMGGPAFGAQAFGVTPDMMTMAKALTNGNQPMGAVAVADHVYDAIVDAAPGGAVEFFHGYTYSGHPAACAAGIATLDIYERDGIFARAQELSPYFQDAMFSLRDAPLVTDIRGFGLMAGFDIEPMGGAGVRGLDFTKRLFEAGLHIKMTGDSGIVAPPLIARREHVDQIVDILRRTLESY